MKCRFSWKPLHFFVNICRCRKKIDLIFAKPKQAPAEQTTITYCLKIVSRNFQGGIPIKPVSIPDQPSVRYFFDGIYL